MKSTHLARQTRELRAVMVAGVALLTLMEPVGAPAHEAEFTTTCTCSVFEDTNGKSIQEPLLTQAPLVNGTRVSSPFGMRMHPILGHWAMHRGVDVAAPSGSPIYAPADGVIEEARDRGELGLHVIVRHNDTLATGYAHASYFAAGIHPGVHVKRGQVIAYVGSTGLSTGPHLHYEIFVKGWRVNPTCRCSPPSPPQGRNKARLTREGRLVQTIQTTQKEGL
jgi:murein DD-endopeptidase MepM/ murein hydrolase activator NlpD